MKLGELGEQIVIKSKYAFSKLEFIEYEHVKKEEYYVLRKNRNDEVNKKYLKMLEENNDGIYIQDIIRGEIKNDGPRIPRNIFK